MKRKKRKVQRQIHRPCEVCGQTGIVGYDVVPMWKSQGEHEWTCLACRKTKLKSLNNT